MIMEYLMEVKTFVQQATFRIFNYNNLLIFFVIQNDASTYP